MEPEKLIDWLKLSPRYLIPVWVTLVIALFVPGDIVDRLGIASLRPYLGLALLLFTILLVADGAIRLSARVKALRSARAQAVERKRLLHRLADDEKNVLAQYVKHDTKSRTFPFGDGTVMGLVAKGIPFSPTQVARMYDWPFKYL